MTKIKASYLDNNNIVWKMIKGEWIGKRSVWTLEWLQHLQEELMDATLYIEKLKKSNVLK